MRRLFAKQPVITPFEQPSQSYASISPSGAKRDNYGAGEGWEHTSPTFRNAALSSDYNHTDAPIASDPYVHVSPAEVNTWSNRGAAAGYPSYGEEVHTSKKGKQIPEDSHAQHEGRYGTKSSAGHSAGERARFSMRDSSSPSKNLSNLHRNPSQSYRRTEADYESYQHGQRQHQHEDSPSQNDFEGRVAQYTAPFPNPYSSDARVEGGEIPGGFATDENRRSRQIEQWRRSVGDPQYNSGEAPRGKQEAFQQVHESFNWSASPERRLSTSVSNVMSPQSQSIGYAAIRAEDRYVDRNISDDTRHVAHERDGGKDLVKRMLFGRKKQSRGQKEDTDNSAHTDDIDPPSGESNAHRASSPLGHREGRASPKKGLDHGHAGAAWLDWKGIGKQAPKPISEGAITHQVGWLCALDELQWKLSEMQSLFDAISHSEAASKEAARAMRKEFKYGTDDTRYRAVKLLGLLYLHTGDRFRLQVANKRFLESVEDLYKDKRTPTRTRGRLLVCWSMLAHESHVDSELQTITKMFNKIKPSDMPINGSPLDASSELFQLADESDMQMSNALPVQQSTHHSASQSESSSAHLSNAQREEQIAFSHPSEPEEAVHSLHEDCKMARSYAQLLTESLIEHGLDGALLSEFTEKCRSWQELISAQIPVVSAAAEDRKQSRHSATGDPDTTARPTSHGPDAVLLQDLLETNEKLSAALSMLHDAEEHRREEEEEAQILNRSLREMRMDRSALIHDPVTGHMYHLGDTNLNGSAEGSQASGSRSVSPAGGQSLELAPDNNLISRRQDGLLAPPMQASRSSQSPSAAQQSLDRSASAPNRSDKLSSTGIIPSGMAGTYQLGPRPMKTQETIAISGSTSPRLPTKKVLTNLDLHQSKNPTEEDESSHIMTPIQPSEKALGKRRAISVHENSPTYPPGAETAAAINQAFASNASEIQQGSTLLSRPPPALPRPSIAR